MLESASVAKIFVLLELADRITAGTIERGMLVNRRNSSAVHDSGVWHAMLSDLLPVADVALLVGAVSDNWATNALIDLCGLDRIQALARSIAPGGSTLNDHVRDDRGPGLPPTLSYGCAADWVSIVQRLPQSDSGRQVLHWLAQNTDLSMVASAFGLDPLAHDVDDLALRLWNKTGTDAGVRADVGTVRSGTSAVSYAVICNWPDSSAGVRRDVLRAMHLIGAQIAVALDAGSAHDESDG